MTAVAVVDMFLISKMPLWYRTPKAQTAMLGMVFFFVFTGWTTIQFFSQSTYGADLAADCVSVVYFTFTVTCLVSPGFVNKWGCRLCIFLGVLGYGPIVLTSVIYFLYGGEDVLWARRLVVLAGAVVGCGAATLWTSQGRLILEYASRAEELDNAFSSDRTLQFNTGAGGRTPDCPDMDGAVSKTYAGELVGCFWAIFQMSGLVGGAISFLYYDSKREGSAALYVLFLLFIIAGALFTQFLLPHSMLENAEFANSHNAGIHNEEMVHSDRTPLIDHSPSDHARVLKLSQPTENHETACEELSPNSWRQEAWESFKLACTKRLMCLSPLFFYTGFNQPYQQATFGNRIFTRRTIGAELIIFHLMEIVGAICCGRFLDRNDRNPSDAHRRRRAVACLTAFIVINAAGNALAASQEHIAALNPAAMQHDIAQWSVLPPSLAFACWGFADAQIQVYCYWLIGSFYSSGSAHSRAVGWYKCVQSLGTSIGFFLIPTSRLSEMLQLMLSSMVFVVGVTLALFHLPT